MFDYEIHLNILLKILWTTATRENPVIWKHLLRLNSVRKLQKNISFIDKFFTGNTFMFKNFKFSSIHENFLPKAHSSANSQHNWECWENDFNFCTHNDELAKAEKRKRLGENIIAQNRWLLIIKKCNKMTQTFSFSSIYCNLWTLLSSSSLQMNLEKKSFHEISNILSNILHGSNF